MGHLRKTAKNRYEQYLYIPPRYSDLIVQNYLSKDGRIQPPWTTFLSQALQPNPMPLLCYQCRTKVTEASACGFVFCSGVTTEIANQLSNEGLASPSTSGYKLQGSITEKTTVMIKFPFLSSVSRDIQFSQHIPDTCWPERPFYMRMRLFRVRWTQFGVTVLMYLSTIIL